MTRRHLTTARAHVSWQIEEKPRQVVLAQGCVVMGFPGSFQPPARLGFFWPFLRLTNGVQKGEQLGQRPWGVWDGPVVREGFLEEVRLTEDLKPKQACVRKGLPEKGREQLSPSTSPLVLLGTREQASRRLQALQGTPWWMLPCLGCLETMRTGASS